MGSKIADLLADVAGYYSAKLAEHGQTARGVDWNGEASQILRFEQLTRIIDPSGYFSLNDLGCGYGALLDYLQSRHQDFEYNGYDVSDVMVRAAQSRHAPQRNARFVVAAIPSETADYGIASGIFNVRLSRSQAEWSAYVAETLDKLHRTSRRGFAFNCLTSYSDAHRMKDELFYADPCLLFDLCKRCYAKDVALLHDYGLYEFTILVRKQT